MVWWRVMMCDDEWWWVMMSDVSLEPLTWFQVYGVHGIMPRKADPEEFEEFPVLCNLWLSQLEGIKKVLICPLMATSTSANPMHPYHLSGGWLFRVSSLLRFQCIAELLSCTSSKGKHSMRWKQSKSSLRASQRATSKWGVRKNTNYRTED